MKVEKENPELVLTSHPMIHAPGMVSWGRAIDIKTFRRERANLIAQIGFFAELFPTAPGWVAI
jgi:hypothetical protein